MGYQRSRGAFIGTSEASTVASLASGSTQTGSEKDILQDDTSDGDIWVYLVYDATSTSGSIDVRINPRRDTGQAYLWPSYQVSVTPVNGTGNKVPIGKFPAERYMTGDIKNNGLGSNLTNFALLYSLVKLS